MIVSDPLNYAGLSPRRPFSLLYQLQQKFHKLVIKKTKMINNIGSLFLLIFSSFINRPNLYSKKTQYISKKPYRQE